jgi:hypothetical protein
LTPCEIALNLKPPPIDLPDIVGTFGRGFKEGASQDRHRLESCLLSVCGNMSFSEIAVGVLTAAVASKYGTELSKFVVDMGG